MPSKKAVAKKAVTRKAVARKAVTKKAVARKAVARKAVARKAVARKAVAKKAVARKAVARKAGTKKAGARARASRGVDAQLAEDRAAALRYFKSVQQYPELEREHAQSVLEKYKQEIYAKEGVLSADVGIKVSKGVFTGVFAIRIYVSSKLPEYQPEAKVPEGCKVVGRFVVPKSYSKSQIIPDEYDGVPTDVIESGNFSLAALPRPIGGDAIWAEGPDPDDGNQNKKSGEGTMALGVVDINGQEFYLTCTHCFSFKNHDVSPPVVNSVRTVFASEQVGGSFINARIVGNVDPASCRADGVVDCALVTPDPKRKFFRVPVRDKGDVQPRTIRLPREGDEVWTRGRNPEERRFGKIAAINGSFPLPGITAVQQIMIHSVDNTKPFASAGDSGAIVCCGKGDEPIVAVGIIRAVSDKNALVAACPLMTSDGRGVADVLKFTLRVPAKP